MNLNKVKKTICIFFKLFIIFPVACILCEYGYASDLPELGKTTRASEKNELQVKQTSPVKNTGQFEFPVTKTFFPGINSTYNIDRYSEYLQDIKQVEPILISLKQVMKLNNSDKIQQFSAKVNIFNLYIDTLKEKYNNKPEKNYASFKQLVILDKYLTETSNYQRITDKYRKNLRGSLLNKIEDETYIRKKTGMALNSIDAVLDIIQNAN